MNMKLLKTTMILNEVSLYVHATSSTEEDNEILSLQHPVRREVWKGITTQRIRETELRWK
jgi:hypothetical protein